MIPAHILLAQRIRDEVAELERMVKRVQRAWEATQQGQTDWDLFIDSTALNLHGFYSAIERLLEHTAYQLEGSLPKGPDWHTELLRQMSTPLPGLRPAVLSVAMITLLDEFRRFRHVVRNVYAKHLDPERIGQLVKRLTAVWPQLATELEAFARFLEGVSHADDLR